MCWSAEVSLETFIFSFGVFTFAYLFGFKPKLLFIYFWFFLMQLIEFFLWRNIDDTYWNRFFSLMAFSLLAIQPLAITLIISNDVFRMWFLGLYAIYVSLTLYVHFSEKDKIDYSVNIANNGHLTWNWVVNYEKIYYIYHIFFAILIIEKEYVAFFIIFLTNFYSFINYHQHETFSSMWCWTANIVGLLILTRVVYANRNL